ncbi:MAG: hypothetical protein RID07_01555 [Lacipirellulaceae bacterium]
MNGDLYQQWLAQRREIAPPETLPDEIMGEVFELEQRRQEFWWLLLAQQVERSRIARCGMCGGALAIGGLPFLFLT